MMIKFDDDNDDDDDGDDDVCIISYLYMNS